MKSLLGVVCIFLVSLSGAAQGSAQPKVSDADMKELADAFGAMMDANAKKPEQAQADFVKEFERIDKLIKPVSILAMPEVWTEVFYAKRAASIEKAPSGLGRVEEKTITGSAFRQQDRRVQVRHRSSRPASTEEALPAHRRAPRQGGLA